MTTQDTLAGYTGKPKPTLIYRRSLAASARKRQTKEQLRYLPAITRNSAMQVALVMWKSLMGYWVTAVLIMCGRNTSKTTDWIFHQPMIHRTIIMNSI